MPAASDLILAATKTCSRCERALGLDDFFRGSGTHGRQAYCKRCSGAYKRTRYAETRDRDNASRRERLRSKATTARRARRHEASVAGRELANEIDPGFGHWLAGFIDGEGSFIIGQNRSHGGYFCIFRLALRADDREILDEACQRLGLGRVTEAQREQYGNPQVLWQVWGQRQVAMLVEILRRYPLRAKKARDFAIWAAAIDAWIARPSRTGSWDEMARLADEIQQVRRYA
jgi:hypothetical protein